MSDDQATASGSPLLSWIGLYVACLAIFALAAYLEYAFDLPTTITTYLVIGFVLNRRIGRKVAFHPHYNTLSNAPTEKLLSFFLWPVMYFFLLFHVVINKVL